MKNRINLSKYHLRTDLIIDDASIKGKIIKYDNATINKVNKDGNYITITFEDITNYEDREKVGKLLEKELKELFEKNNIKDSDECLVIGLGNRLSTADSLGVKVLDHIVITRHLFLINANVKEGFRIVSGFTPSVLGQTGIETKDVIVSLINAVKPKFVIAIDSLASSSIDRINKTIQITDTGIHPGSGVGNNRKELSKKTLGIPVIAIGVPTVVSSSIIVNDTLNYLFKHLSYIKDNKENDENIDEDNDNDDDKSKSKENDAQKGQKKANTKSKNKQVKEGENNG